MGSDVKVSTRVEYSYNGQTFVVDVRADGTTSAGYIHDGTKATIGAHDLPKAFWEAVVEAARMKPR